MSSILDQIGVKHGCDKSSLHHGYCAIYDDYFGFPFPPGLGDRVLEIGYGGYDDPNAGGESARMWKEWAPDMELTIVDLYPKNNIPSGVTFICGSQTDPNTYKGQRDWKIIIDDGSHLNKDIVDTFQLLWPRLSPGGYYVVEDIHSSYHSYYPDSCPNPDPQFSKGTAMSFFTRLVHEVNRDHICPWYHLGYDIAYIHFYKDLIIIKKA